MKNIKFSSFPLVDIDDEEKSCIDTYSIKNFADLITMNTQLRSTSADINQYITPDVVMKYFNDPSINQSLNASHMEGSKQKEHTIKRAFKALQNMSKVVKSNPFYKDKVTYPIYIEHQNKNNNHDYDFLLLTNDLVPKEILQEISYDDTITLIFLFLKDQLYPTEILPQLGFGGSDGNIRADIAKFIEFSKQNNTDPISAMLKLIRIAGKKKQKEGSQYNGLISFAKADKAINSSISSKFFKLFGGDRKSGQIKDINFLLNEIKHLDIADFFDDMSVQNQYSHTQNSPYAGQSTEIERQYLSSKVTDYNKILSMVDSLIHFNQIKKVMEDVHNSVADNSIKLPSENGMIDVDINYDQLMGSLRDEYFEAYIISLVKRLNDHQLNLADKLKIYDSPMSMMTPTSINNVEYLTLEVHSLQKEVDELASTEFNARQNGDQETADNVSVLLGHKQEALENQQQLLMKANNMAVFSNGKDMEFEKQQLLNSEKKSKLTYNIGAIQNELVGILKDIEASLYDPKLLQEIFTIISKKSEFKLEQLKELLTVLRMNYNIERLTEEILGSLKDTLSHEAFKNQKGSEEEIEKIFNDTENKQKVVVESLIYGELLTLFRRMGRDYGDAKLVQAQEYADLRTEKNPIIRKTVGKENNFKTYILNEDVLKRLYEILNYVDNQKYIAGLIAYPPSKINNDLNQIKYILNRLGLDNNPVFIISQGNVILSSPDFLSMTGTPIMSKISFAEMFKVCKVNYEQDLYNKNQMFKKDTYKNLQSLDSALHDAFTKATKDSNNNAILPLKERIEKAKFNMKSYKHGDPENAKASQELEFAQQEASRVIKKYKDDSGKLTEKSADSRAANEYGTSEFTQPNDESRSTNHHQQHGQYEYLTKDKNQNGGGKKGQKQCPKNMHWDKKAKNGRGGCVNNNQNQRNNQRNNNQQRSNRW